MASFTSANLRQLLKCFEGSTNLGSILLAIVMHAIVEMHLKIDFYQALCNEGMTSLCWEE